MIHGCPHCAPGIDCGRHRDDQSNEKETIASLRARTRMLTLEQALRKIIDAADLTDLESAIHESSALLAASRGREPERCEGRYPVPQTSPPRDEPFDVTYRCALPLGHEGPHRSGDSGGRDPRPEEG